MAEEKSSSSGNKSAIFNIDGQCEKSSMNFIIVWKWLSPGQYRPIFKSECKPQQKGLNDWNEFIIDTMTLCNNDDDQEIKIDVLKFDSTGSHKVLGSAYTTLAELKGGPSQLSANKQTLILKKFELKQSTSFIEYVFGGCQINLNIAIDFTMSNGHPVDSTSLHNLKDPRNNEYIQAIRGVGDILQYYDSDKEIPTYGFGAKVIKGSNSPSHCFALNGDIFKPECAGIDGVLEAYQNSIKKVSLYGPTNFSEIISAINDRCEASEVSQNNQQYQILMIITDGVISDF